jgi:uncharacterized protein
MNKAEAMKRYLQERQGQKFTAQQLAEWFFQTYPDECKKKLARSPTLSNDEDLLNQLRWEVYSSFGPHAATLIKHTEDRPRRFYFSPLSDEEEVVAADEHTAAQATGARSRIQAREAELYPKLAAYLWSEYRLYPDMVGLENLSADWIPEIRACVDEYKDKKAKLWSFEVKRLLNRSNVRESFFQAVSNSSWAHFGYLVAAEISGTGTGIRRELEILGAVHGIGVILLAEPAGDSQIIVPARELPAIDWDSCNRLAATNPDFKDYIKYVRQFCQTGEVKNSDWDIPSDPD